MKILPAARPHDSYRDGKRAYLTWLCNPVFVQCTDMHVDETAQMGLIEYILNSTNSVAQKNIQTVGRWGERCCQ